MMKKCWLYWESMGRMLTESNFK